MSEEQLILHIEGMDCHACEAPIVVVLKSIKGVKSVDVKYEEKRGVVIYDASVVDEGTIINTINSLGFKASKV